MVPDSWKITRLGKVASIVRGASPRPAGSPRYFNGAYLPWITVADITSCKRMHLDKTVSMLTEEGIKQSRVFEAGTLLLTHSGATLGVPVITNVQAAANDGVAGFLD